MFQKGNKLGILNRGRFHSIETRQIISMKQKGKHNSLATEFKKGHKSWIEGKKLPEETKLKISKSRVGKCIGENNPAKRPEVRLKIKQNKSGILSKLKGTKNPKHAEQIKNVWERDKEVFLKNRKHLLRVEVTKEMLIDLYFNKQLTQKEIGKIYSVTASTIRHLMRKFDIVISREEAVKRVLKGKFKRPTDLEFKFVQFFNENQLPYRYCGNGSLVIGHKCPDFANVNGEKVCLDVANKIEKETLRRITWNEYVKQRMDHFAEWGWKCIVIEENELKNKDLLLQKLTSDKI